MKKLIAITAMTLLATTAYAGGDAAAGAAKAAVCASCHGEGGKKPIMDSYPKLAGQNAAYLESAIKTYKSQERKGGQAAVMYSMVGALSDQDIADLAAYYASQQ
ncbi:c-type cytochrome [Balneatrix alpica]|uniref:C-type cytochrome n=1 Tax=Balneatrix alpica TaxID=75684 RepID=A0ABV5Z6D0_9GAMM|nr:c-type cytochrome [Balneatrix alpica]